MSKVSEMFPSKWLLAAEIEGKVYRLVISAYGVETYDDGTKMTINFQGAQKGMVLNATNRSTLVWLFGDEADAWIGKEIELFTEPVTFKGKISPGMKVRGINSVQAQPASAMQAPLDGNNQPASVPAQAVHAQSAGPGEQAAVQAVRAVRAEAGMTPQPMDTDPGDLNDPIPF